MEELIDRYKKRIIQASIDMASRGLSMRDGLILIDDKLDKITEIYDKESYSWTVKLNWVWTIITLSAFMMGIAIGHYN